jgi:hypothetical protein
MPFQCNHCAYSYQTMGQWTRHLAQIHRISTISESTIPSHSHPRSEARLSSHQHGSEGMIIGDST